MTKVDYKRIEELYKTLSSIENSGDDVLSDIKKEINNEELLLLKDEIMPYLAKCIALSLQQLRCQMDVSIQYDGSGNLSYSFCKSGSSALVRGNVKPADLLDFRLVDESTNNDATSTEKTRSKTEILRVEYPDGTVIQHPKATDTFVEVIANSYPDLIHELNIVHANVNIVSREYSDQYASAQREISGGWLVFTNTNTRRKREDLIKISEELDLGLKVDIVSIATGEIIIVDDNTNESGRQKIKVSFPDGRIIQPNKVLETIVEVVKYAGPERVRDLNIIVCGDNLVLKKPKHRYIKACKPVGNEWLVNTCSSTPSKYEQIMFISERLNLNIKAEIISWSSTDRYGINDNPTLQLALDNIEEYVPTRNSELASAINKDVGNRRLRIVDYSNKSFVLYGDTSGYEKFLEGQNGVYNKYLPEGPGWLFSKKREIVIMDFFKLKNNEDSDKSDLSTLLGQLSQMKTMKNKWMKSPHKAIYLMALICGIRAGHINHRKICLDDYLIQTFKDLWVKYVPIGFPYAMEIGNPFIHLSSEPFYFLHTISDIPDFNIGWSVSAVKRVCDYAYVSDDFRNIIMSDDNTREITKHLVNEFGLKGCGDFTLANIQNDQNNTAFSNDATCVPKLPKPKIPNRYGAAMFRLTYPSAAVEESDAFLDVYVNFVKKAGAERVRNLGIYSLGANIIAKQEEINIKYKKQYKDIGGGYYFNTISTTQRKYEVMTYISSCLNMGIKVELVAKED